MTNDKTMQQLQGWLSKTRNGRAVIAASLGYKTSETIRQWVLNDRIPFREIERVKSFLKEQQHGISREGN